jgi:hypothetical protein
MLAIFATTVPARVYNDYSVHAGGPIRKNKTFFFADFENSSNHLAALINAALLCPGAPELQRLPRTVLKDPSTGQPFPDNQIPQSRLNPTSLKAQSFFYRCPIRLGYHPIRNYRAQYPLPRFSRSWMAHRS